MFRSDFIEGSKFLYYFGTATIFWIFAKVAYNCYTHYVIYFTQSGVDYTKLKGWAIVTGATDGIGKGIAYKLAEKGFDIVLVSRNQSKLENVANEIENTYKVRTRCITFDFANNDESKDGGPDYRIIEEQIRDLKIAILVNNVGMAPVIHGLFLKTVRKYEGNLSHDIVNCNVTSMTKMHEIVTAHMVEKNEGLIINLSSGLSTLIIPGGAVYSGTKRFNDNLSKSLSYEYEKHGIFVQCIQPAFVSTNMTKEARRKNKWIKGESYDTFAENLLQTVGKARMTHGCSTHAIQIQSLACIPTKLLTIAMIPKKR